MPRLDRLVRKGRLAALIAIACPLLQDVVTEALANVFTDKVSTLGSGWLAIPVGVLAGVVVEKLPSLLRPRGGWGRVLCVLRGLVRFTS